MEKQRRPQKVSQGSPSRDQWLITLIGGMFAAVFGAGLSHIASKFVEQHAFITIALLLVLLTCSVAICGMRIGRKTRGTRQLRHYWLELGAVALLLGTLSGVMYDHASSNSQPPSAQAGSATSSEHPTSTGGGLQIVDVGFIETNELPEIDIKVRNTGQQVAFIKRAEFTVTHTWQLTWPTAGGAVPPSYSYDLQLPMEGTPYTRAVPASQSVEPDGVDRFTFRIAPDQRITPFADYIYSLSIRLVYNESNDTAKSGPLVYCIGYPQFFNAFRNTGEALIRSLPQAIPTGIRIFAWDPSDHATPNGMIRDIMQAAQRNKAIVDQIAAVPGQKNLRLQVLLASR